MRTLRRTALVLIVPAIAWLGAACERMDTPTEPLPPAAFNLSDDANGISTVTVASSPAWGGQHVCLNAASPPLCPPDATQYGYPFPGWTAPRLLGANWIWLRGVTGQTRGADLAQGSFSQTVQLGTPIAGEICLAADDYAELIVNGHFVGSVGSISNPALSGAAQNTCTPFNVTPFLQPGSNTITVNGQNGPKSFSFFQFTGCNPTCNYSENPAGVMFEGTLTSSCPVEDDDDNDGLNNKNEHLLGLLLNDSDSDDDGIVDGNDDGNGNGEDDEDEDDDDECPDPDSDGDGEDDEDEDDDDGDDDD
jgi:hypothetical protein